MPQAHFPPRSEADEEDIPSNSIHDDPGTHGEYVVHAPRFIEE
jgi:hypothetical protein